MGHYSSFVVKIWVDDGNNEGMLRGQIQHVETLESAHFVDLEKMTAFIVNHLNSLKNNLAVGEESLK